jgi:1,4-alpha-glucan branching enzyme
MAKSTQTKTRKPVKAESITQRDADLNRFLSFAHTDPHQLLGVHGEGEAQTIRVFRPDAEKVEVVIGRTRPRLMNRTTDSGLFELVIEGSASVSSYKLRVHRAGGEVTTIRDPYSFPPTIGELDLHLFG